MSRTLLLAASLCAVTLAGCGHTVYRETVVEKQPVVERQTVVTTPAPAVVAPSTLVAVPASPACSIGTAVYSQGTMSCMSGRQFECVDGAWREVPSAGSC